jgi:glycosyltransferase involved in cell wall biosynthesis
VEKSKGVFDLLKAFNLVADKFNSWSLHFIGEGSARQELQNRIESHGLTDRVKSIGLLPREEMFRQIAKSRAVIIPTRLDSLPLTFGEAMQLKRPVIVTDIGDLRQFTEKYKVGLVVPPRSPEYLADAITTFIREKKDYGNRFDACLEELDIDQAANNFTSWLQNYLSHRTAHREAAAV